MPINEELHQSTDFSTIYASLFTLSVTIECLGALQGILSERGFSHARNKAKQAESYCNAAYNQIERAISKGLGDESKEIMLAAVEVQKDTMYKFFTMDTKEQARVRSLIDKLKREGK